MSLRTKRRTPDRTTGPVLKRTVNRSASLISESWLIAKQTLAPSAQAARRWVTRFIAPASRIISPLGFVILATAVLLWLLGALFGWQEAWLGALMAAVLLAAAVFFILGRSDFLVSLDLNRTRVAVGDRAVGALQVKNTAGKTSHGSTMELPVGSGTAQFRIPRLAAGESHEDLFTIPTRRRAVLSVGPILSVRQDPFGLLRRQVKWTDEYELFIHPKTTPLAGSTAGFIRDLEGMSTKDLSSSDVSFHALRDYAPGDDRRHIHWKSSARTGELMVRQFEETRRSHLAVALSLNLDEYGADELEDLELAVSVAASIGWQAISEQRNLSTFTQDGPIRTENGRNLLDGLTRVQGQSMLRDTFVELTRHTADKVPNASVVFILTGASATAAELRKAAMHVPLGVRAIAIRCGLGLDASRANIGELTVLTLGNLDELGLLLKRATS
ncbi:DUF58 domain-containing protein [Arthrobacter sp. MYb211]|uniref:DUF58 domain-containing protein n=1 Tax=unclassified Arthrobacter TaxID=235627 RepID=UPI000CFCC732|nr:MULTISPECIES: DUF58 domain-containing protein [unclassified Arthrobacter]PRA13451.1 DUF58 domain-containing protein [Arthrobacter sp. MYb221]PRC10649.1 DUF58 domain-containing protein [Arthrobacter sp. MYb211]